MTAPRRKPTRAKALGVSDDDYARLLTAQHGHCARTCDLCGKASTTLFEVDGYTGRHVECPSCFQGRP